MANRSKAKAKQPASKDVLTATATESTAQSKRPFALCAGGNEATLLGESLEDAALALEALGIAWQDRAKKIGADDQSVSGDAILWAYMRFGEARERIQRVQRQGVLDYGDGVGRAWMLSVSDALDSVVNELNAHDATMTDLSGELARTTRLNRLANRLRAAQRELAYGHIVAVGTTTAQAVAEPAAVEIEQRVGLLEMAGIVHRKKRTLERYKAKLPPPAVKGGNGRPDEWLWSEVRPVLEQEFGLKLPEHFPASRFLPR